MKRNQLIVFIILLVVYALCAFLTYALFVDQLAATIGVPMPDLGVSNLVLGLANAGIVLVLYGLVGLAGYWFAIKLELPGFYREDQSWQEWVLIPLILGAGCGLVLILSDILFAPFNGLGNFPHPEFPLSILASLSAGIGEEILFRGFFLGLWAYILNWIFRRYNKPALIFWIANIIAALAFGAGHLGTALAVTNSTSLADLNPILLVEMFLLNGIVALVAGQQYRKSGLIAAMGVHFWNNVVWHIIWGLLS